MTQNTMVRGGVFGGIGELILGMTVPGIIFYYISVLHGKRRANANPVSRTSKVAAYIGALPFEAAKVGIYSYYVIQLYEWYIK
jgi:hypothetical protein